MRDQLLQRVPDQPQWVETRSALLEGGTLFGSVDGAAVLTPERDLLCIIGRLPKPALDEALFACSSEAEVVAQEADSEHIARLLDAPGEPAVIHAPGRGGLRCDALAPGWRVETLDENDRSRLDGLPPTLREEILAALGWTPVWAAVLDDQPVSFCYPGSRTEGWWDVSIDTLEPYRHRGGAIAAFTAAARHLQGQGKLPAWGALESNEPSWRLARKLGFHPVAKVFVWTL